MVGAAVVGAVVGDAVDGDAVVGAAVVGVVVSAAFVVVVVGAIVVYTVESTLNQKHVGRPTPVERLTAKFCTPVASSTIFAQSFVQPLKRSSSAKKRKKKDE